MQAYLNSGECFEMMCQVCHDQEAVEHRKNEPMCWHCAKAWDEDHENYWVFLDDEREPGDPVLFDAVVRSLEGLKNYIKEVGECPVFISFDHDLGPDQPTGKDIANYLVNRDIDEEGLFLPRNFDFDTHTMNPIGGKNISGILLPYLELRKKAKNW